jgi:phage shock protein A
VTEWLDATLQHVPGDVAALEAQIADLKQVVASLRAQLADMREQRDKWQSRAERVSLTAAYY